MACGAGCCGSCVFTEYPGYEFATILYCKIQNDPEVSETYTETSVDKEEWKSTFSFEKIKKHVGDYGICSKYQLNPVALEY